MKDTARLFEEFKIVQKEWLTALEAYSEEEITKVGSDDLWTIGQVYNHLIQATLLFQGKQIEVCLVQIKDIEKRKNFRGFMVYSILKKFPPVKIKVPASKDYTPLAPTSKKELIDGMQKSLEMMELWQKEIVKSTESGKTMHPGFSYLNAKEWYQLIVMHWKHHLRQKEMLDKVKQNI